VGLRRLTLQRRTTRQNVVLTVGGKTVHYNGEGSSYAAATLFTFGLTTQSEDNLGFSVTMDVGPHPTNGTDTALWLRPSGPYIEPKEGAITVNHWNTRDPADGELAAKGQSTSIRGHWGCRFESH
jgi:hypothetical protein